MNLVKNTLSEQIYQILRNDILTQAIPMGEKLTLKTLQERFGVSSTPIRDAFTRLTEEGLVNYYSNIGVSVIDFTREDLMELYQFMGDLDALAIRYSAKYPEQEQVKASLKQVLFDARALKAPSEEGILSGNREQWIQCSDKFHLVFYDYCQNGRLTRAAEKLRSQLTIFSNVYESQQEPQKLIFEWHTRIYDSYCRGEIEKAAVQMKEHLEQSLTFALAALKNEKTN